jgi:hypothetical protein
MSSTSQLYYLYVQAGKGEVKAQALEKPFHRGDHPKRKSKKVLL